MSEAKSQYRDSWGDCMIIQPNEIVLDFDQEMDPPAIVGFSIDDRVLSALDDSAIVRINIERKLRSQRFDCGTVGAVKPLPTDIIDGTSDLKTVGKGRYRWRLRIVDSSGHVIAQTDTKNTGAEPLIGGPDNAILRISKGEVGSKKSWEIEFGEGSDAPVVVVDKTLDDLFQAFKSRGEELWHALPKMVADIIDQLISYHTESYPIEFHPAGTWEHDWTTVLVDHYNIPIPEGLNNELEDAHKLLDWKSDCIDAMCNRIDIRARLVPSDGVE